MIVAVLNTSTTEPGASDDSSLFFRDPIVIYDEVLFATIRLFSYNIVKVKGFTYDYSMQKYFTFVLLNISVLVMVICDSMHQ